MPYCGSTGDKSPSLKQPPLAWHHKRTTTRSSFPEPAQERRSTERPELGSWLNPKRGLACHTVWQRCHPVASSLPKPFGKRLAAAERSPTSRPKRSWTIYAMRCNLRQVLRPLLHCKCRTARLRFPENQGLATVRCANRRCIVCGGDITQLSAVFISLA